jgi:ParB family transcriptional regulator, chromosome partitioning protein
MNDLFQADNGGWLQDVALVGRLVAERLEKEADNVRAEGWKWVECTPDLPYGYAYGLRRLYGTTEPLTTGGVQDLLAVVKCRERVCKPARVRFFGLVFCARG